MNKYIFLDKRNLKKLTEKLNEREVILTHSHFIPMDQLGHGRNGASDVLRFVETHHEIEGLRLRRPSKRLGDGSSLGLYTHSRNSIGQTDFGRERGWLLTFSNGKQTVAIDTQLGHSFGSSENEDRELRDRLRYAIGEKGLETISISDVEYVGRYDKIENLSDRTDLVEYAEANGWKVKDVFEYNSRFWLCIDKVTVSKNKVELAYKTLGTYNSLPQLVTLKHRKKVDSWDDKRKPMIQTQGLAELGVERPGWYSHQDRMKVLDTQVPEVKAFFKKYQRVTRQK